MKPILIALFTLCAATSIARAEDVVVLPAATVEQPSADAQARQADQARVAAERRQRMIDECITNHGYENDCVREVDTELRAEGLRVIHLRAPH